MQVVINYFALKSDYKQCSKVKPKKYKRGLKPALNSFATSAQEYSDKYPQRVFNRKNLAKDGLKIETGKVCELKGYEIPTENKRVGKYPLEIVRLFSISANVETPLELLDCIVRGKGTPKAGETSIYFSVYLGNGLTIGHRSLKVKISHITNSGRIIYDKETVKDLLNSLEIMYIY